MTYFFIIWFSEEKEQANSSGHLESTGAFVQVSPEKKKKQATCYAPEGYKSSNDEKGAEDVILEGEQSQAHVGKDKILSQEMKDLKKLQEKWYDFRLMLYEYRAKREVKLHRGAVKS